MEVWLISIIALIAVAIIVGTVSYFVIIRDRDRENNALLNNGDSTDTAAPAPASGSQIVPSAPPQPAGMPLPNEFVSLGNWIIGPINGTSIAFAYATPVSGWQVQMVIDPTTGKVGILPTASTSQTSSDVSIYRPLNKTELTLVPPKKGVLDVGSNALLIGSWAIMADATTGRLNIFDSASRTIYVQITPLSNESRIVINSKDIAWNPAPWGNTVTWRSDPGFKATGVPITGNYKNTLSYFSQSMDNNLVIASTLAVSQIYGFIDAHTFSVNTVNAVPTAPPPKPAPQTLALDFNWTIAQSNNTVTFAWMDRPIMVIRKKGTSDGPVLGLAQFDAPTAGVDNEQFADTWNGKNYIAIDTFVSSAPAVPEPVQRIAHSGPLRLGSYWAIVPTNDTLAFYTSLGTTWRQAAVLSRDMSGAQRLTIGTFGGNTGANWGKFIQWCSSCPLSSYELSSRLNSLESSGDAIVLNGETVLSGSSTLGGLMINSTFLLNTQGSSILFTGFSAFLQNGPIFTGLSGTLSISNS